jgi:hypothetical protein
MRSARMPTKRRGRCADEAAGRPPRREARDAVDELVEGSLRGGFDVDSEGDGGNFEFHFRVAPKGPDAAAG